jgi:hypothetical protein
VPWPVGGGWQTRKYEEGRVTRDIYMRYLGSATDELACSIMLDPREHIQVLKRYRLLTFNVDYQGEVSHPTA